MHCKIDFELALKPTGQRTERLSNGFIFTLSAVLGPALACPVSAFKSRDALQRNLYIADTTTGAGNPFEIPNAAEHLKIGIYI